MTARAWVVGGFTLLCLAAALLLPPIPQPLAYHAFADGRMLFGIPNFFDVASNVAFLIGGAIGLIVTFHSRTRFEFSRERWPYAIFFVGVTLTALGSSYYHLAPDNERLFWDRLPMTIAFMSLIAAQIGDRVSVRTGLALLLPMLLVGAASVIYWRITERAGVGNVLPYGILQGYSVVILLLLAALFPSRYTRAEMIYAIFAAYLVAKLMEIFDRQILAAGGFASGHTLKHLVAGLAGLIVCRMLWVRAPLAAEAHTATPS